MTKESFIAEYKALQAKKQEIEDRMSALKEEYIKSLPFKVGDCVRVNDGGYFSTEKAWIVKIGLHMGWRENYNRFNLTVVEPKKDGTPSRRERELHLIKPDDVEVLEEI